MFYSEFPKLKNKMETVVERVVEKEKALLERKLTELFEVTLRMEYELELALKQAE